MVADPAMPGVPERSTSKPDAHTGIVRQATMSARAGGGGHADEQCPPRVSPAAPPQRYFLIAF